MLKKVSVVKSKLSPDWFESLKIHWLLSEKKTKLSQLEILVESSLLCDSFVSPFGGVCWILNS